MSELYVFGKYQWDIDKAQEILKQAPRPTHKVPVKALTSTLGLVHVDPAHALTVDLTIPVILGWIYVNGNWHQILIDGNHRAYRARQLKKKTLPAYILTKEENYQILRGPFKEELNPQKTYILDYQTAQNTRRANYLYSRDDFYRQRIIGYLEALEVNEALNYGKLAAELGRREIRYTGPRKVHFTRLSRRITQGRYPAFQDIDWILFGGQHSQTHHRIYINLRAETFSKKFGLFIKWFVKKFSQVAYAKIPSLLFHRRFYRQHDSFIIYTILKDPEEVHNLVDACLEKLEKLEIETDQIPSQFYIIPEQGIEHSFHLDLAGLVYHYLKDLQKQHPDFQEFLDIAIQACDTDGELTKLLLEKKMIL